MIETIRRHQELRSKPLNDQLELDLAARVQVLLGLEQPVVPSLKIPSNNPGDKGTIIYMRNKKLFGEKVGVNVGIDMWVEPGFDTDTLNLGGPEGVNFYEGTAVAGMIRKIDNYNNDPGVHAIMTQLPLLERLYTDEVIGKIDPSKDGDGLLGPNSHFLAATPLGVIWLLKKYGFHFAQGSMSVVGAKSATLGVPLQDIRSKVRGDDDGMYPIELQTSERARIDAFSRSDIVVGTSRHPGAINSELMAKRLESNRPLAIIDASGVDVSDELRALAPEHWYITPKLGGLGPLTIRMLIGNTVLSAERAVGIDRYRPIVGSEPGEVIDLPSSPFDAELLNAA